MSSAGVIASLNFSVHRKIPYINDFEKFGRVYRVQTEAEALYRSRPDDLLSRQRTKGKSLVPAQPSASERP